MENEEEDIVMFSPSEDDGENGYQMIVNAIEGRDGMDVSFMRLFVAPAVREILNYRAEAEINDAQFFAGVATAVANLICILSEGVVAEGNVRFAREVLRAASAVIAYKLGQGVLSDKDAILRVIRRSYN